MRKRYGVSERLPGLGAGPRERGGYAELKMRLVKQASCWRTPTPCRIPDCELAAPTGMRHVNAFRAVHDVEVAAAAQRRCCVREKLNRASGGLRREANRNPRAGASRFPYPARGAVCDASGSPFLPAPYLVEPGVLIVPLNRRNSNLQPTTYLLTRIDLGIRL